MQALRIGLVLCQTAPRQQKPPKDPTACGWNSGVPEHRACQQGGAPLPWGTAPQSPTAAPRAEAVRGTRRRGGDSSWLGVLLQITATFPGRWAVRSHLITHSCYVFHTRRGCTRSASTARPRGRDALCIKGGAQPPGLTGSHPHYGAVAAPTDGFLGDADAVVGVTELCLRLQSSAVTQPICNTPGTASSPGPEPRPSPGGRAEEQRRVLPPVRTAAAAHGYAVRAQLLLCSSASLFCTKSGRRRKQLECDLHCVCYCLVATAPPEQSRHPRSYEPAFINRYFQRDTASRDNANAAVLRRLTRNGSALLHSPPSPGTALYVET